MMNKIITALFLTMVAMTGIAAADPAEIDVTPYELV